MQLKENFVEALIGAGVLAVAALFVGYAYTHTEMGQAGSGYQLLARFPSAVGVNVGTDVRVSGIKVGTVVAQDLDPKTFQARVRFSVRKDVELPVDTSAKISSEGLLGNSYIALTPGGEMDVLKPGDEIEQTQGSVDLMSLIGRAIYSVGDKKDDGKAGESAAPATEGQP